MSIGKAMVGAALAATFLCVAPAEVNAASGNIGPYTVTGAKTYGAWYNPSTYAYSATVYTDDTLADSKCAGSRYSYYYGPNGFYVSGYWAVNQSGAGTTRVQSFYTAGSNTVSWSARRSAVVGCDM